MTKKNKFKRIKILLGSTLLVVTSYIVYNQFLISDCKKVSIIEKQIINSQNQHGNKVNEIRNRYRILGVNDEEINIAVGNLIILDENDDEMNRIVSENKRLSTNLNDLNNTEDNCEKKLPILEKLKLIKSQQYDLMQKRFDDELSLALKYQSAPKGLINIFNSLKDTASIKYTTPPVVGLLLNKLLNYKLDPDIEDVIKFEIENSIFLLLENRIQESKDYYLILKNMLTIDKNGCMCLETYKDENEKVLTRDIEKNPNYILDNEKKIRELLLESPKNQNRLDSILAKKGIYNQNDWYVNQE